MKVIYHKCHACGGTGEGNGLAGIPPTTPVTLTCGVCGGTGKHEHGELSDDLMDLLNDMNDKINDIFEKVNE